MVSAYEHAHRARSKQDSVLALMEQAQPLCEDDRGFVSSYMDALVWLRRPFDAEAEALRWARRTGDSSLVERIQPWLPDTTIPYYAPPISPERGQSP